MRLNLSRTTWVLLAVLVLAIAGIVHIVSVLALPWRSRDDAFARVAAVTAGSGRAVLDAAGQARLPFTDPAMRLALCRFDLSAKPFRLTLSPLTDSFVTVGFHSRHGLAFYGMTVHAGEAAAFDLVLTQAAEARGEAPEQDARRVAVPAPEAEGFVTLATPLDDGGPEAADERLRGFDCRWDAAPAS